MLESVERQASRSPDGQTECDCERRERVPKSENLNKCIRRGTASVALPEAPVKRRRARHRLSRYFFDRDRVDPRGDARVTSLQARASRDEAHE